MSITVPIRNYNKLYLGANEHGGVEDPGLSFGVLSKRFIFKPDVSNKFVYPTYAPTVAIKNTSLIVNGAFAGAYPLKADRIKYTDDCLPLGETTMHDPFGKFLITWLFGESLTSDNAPLWLDRWYNPSYISEKQALNIGLGGNPAIRDRISRFYFQPGVSYEYFHYGNYTNNETIKTFNKNKKLVFHFDNWKTDESGNKNKFEIVDADIISTPNLLINRDVPLIEKPAKTIVEVDKSIPSVNLKTRDDSILNLKDNPGHVEILYNNELIQPNNLTVAFWVKTDEWDKVEGHHIISNGFRSGWNVKINNGFRNPTLTFMGSKIFDIYNFEGQYLHTDDLTALGTVIDYKQDNELFAYILMKSGSTFSIYKFDIATGLFKDDVYQMPANTTPYNILIDADEKIRVVYLAQTNDLYYKLLSTDLTEEDDIPLTGVDASYKSFKIGLDSNIVSKPLNTLFDIDNNNDVWTAVNIADRCEIYRNDALVYNIDTLCRQLICDADDRLWIVTDRTIIIYDISQITIFLQNIDILNIQGTLLNTIELINIDPSLANSDDSFIDFIRIHDDVKYVTRAIIVNKNNMWYFDESGKVFNQEILTRTITSSTIKKISTYEWNRKFNFVKNNKAPTIQAQFYTAQSNTNYNTKIDIPFNRMSPNDWHHIVVSIQEPISPAPTGRIKFYLDTQLIDTKEFIGDIFHIYETSLLIGIDAGRTGPLYKELKVQNCRCFHGYIDDVRLYNDVLTPTDIESLYIDKFRLRDIIFNLKLSKELYYIEEIERLFKFKLPGSKSPLYNIKIAGFKSQSRETRNIIENIIYNTVQYIAPAHTELYKITWADD